MIKNKIKFMLFLTILLALMYSPRADVTSGTAVFLHAPNGDFNAAHEDTIMNYISWDNTQWTVKIVDNVFIHAPNGNFQNAHTDIIMNYKTWDNTNWTVKVRDNIFIHAPNGNFQNAHEDVIMNYKTWGNTNWTAKISRRRSGNGNGYFGLPSKFDIVTFEPGQTGYQNQWTLYYPEFTYFANKIRESFKTKLREKLNLISTIAVTVR